MVHLLHRLYGVDAPAVNYISNTVRTAKRNERLVQQLRPYTDYMLSIIIMYSLQCQTDIHTWPYKTQTKYRLYAHSQFKFQSQHRQQTYMLSDTVTARPFCH